MSRSIVLGLGATRYVALIAMMGLALPTSASATWSIVAVDPTTGEVGSAGASCTSYVAGIVGVVPGKGVIVAQAMSNPLARRLGIELLRQGKSPTAVVSAITSPVFDDSFAEQQYGVAALAFAGAPAAFTGADTHGWHGHLLAPGVAVQGNILTGPEVVSATLDAFRKDPARPLAERLLAALEAGGASGGDRRCGSQTARSAYLVVARPGDSASAPAVRIVVPGQGEGGPNPVHLLRQRYGLGTAGRVLP
ncbi:MAG: DUF1028 domain-containing protein [Luteitalea sp.]